MFNIKTLKNSLIVNWLYFLRWKQKLHYAVGKTGAAFWRKKVKVANCFSESYYTNFCQVSNRELLL